MKRIRENTNIKFGIILSYASIAVSLIANIFLQRFINMPENEIISAQYNLYSFSSSISSLLTIFTLGLTSGYIRFATRSEKEAGEEGLKKTNAVYGILLSISALVAFLIGTLLSVLFITGVIPLTNYSESEIKLITAFLFLGTINVSAGFLLSIFTIFLNYRSKFIVVRLLTLVFSTASPLISLPFIKYFNNLLAFSIVHISLTLISLFIQIIYAVFLLKYRINLKLGKGSFGYFKEILTFTFFVFLVEIFIQVDTNADKILLGFFAPSGSDGANASAVGSYNIAFSIVSVIGTSCSAVFSAYAPKINRAVVANDHGEVLNVFNRTTEIALLVYFFIFGGFLSCGEQFILAWLGKERFYVYYIVLALLVVNVIPYTINITSEIQRAYNKHKFRSYSMLGMAAFNIIFTLVALLLVKHFATESSSDYIKYQLIAVISVTLFSSLLFHGLIMAIYNKKIIGLPIMFYYKKLLIYLLITAIPSSITIILYHFVKLSSLGNWISTIIIGLTFVILFVITILLFNRRFVFSLFKNKQNQTPIKIKDGDLQVVKKIELDILKDIIRVCDILNVEYYCVGGTALGAVKYKGFIPWDDDIDIAMKRKDFDRFIKESPKYLKDYYFVQSIETEHNFCSTIAKVRDSRTVYDEISTSKLNIKGGVFVDIFPIDNAFHNKLRKTKYKVNYAKINSSIDKTTQFSSFKSILIDFITAFIPISKTKLMKKNIELLRTNNETGYLYCRGKTYHSDIFKGVETVSFEGLMVKIPKGINTYLTQSYGDIELDPPEKEQVSHHFVYRFNIDGVRSHYENSDN